MLRRPLLAWLAAVVALACGGNEFQSGGTESGGGSSGMGGTGALGGTGGDAGMTSGGSSGAAGSGPTGGTAGMPSCMCQPTEYCRGGDCLPCGVLSTVDFGEPELMLDDPASSLRFPRAGDGPGSLFYRSGDEAAGRLFFTASSTALGSFVGDPAVGQQSGPLFIDLGRTFNLIFDESNAGARSARAASWSGGTIGSDADMPSPLGPSNFEDYSVAATSMGRVYWMSTRDAAARLRTGNLGTGESDVVGIEVPKRIGTGTCPRDGADATPWVSPDGRRMFFRAFALDDNCQPIENSTTDLFVVPLDPDSGLPAQPAVALASLNEVGSNETDPSLSPDFCALYFASDRGSPGSSNFKLYRAPRR